MKHTLEFDCRIINDGKRCQYLHPNKNMRLAKTLKMFVCRDRNLIIMAELKDSGKTTEKITSIGPFNNCCQMRKLQSEGLAQWAEFSINPDGTVSHWNPEINNK